MLPLQIEPSGKNWPPLYILLLIHRSGDVSLYILTTTKTFLLNFIFSFHTVKPIHFLFLLQMRSVTFCYNVL